MHSSPPAPAVEAALQGLGRAEPHALHTCLQAFAPLLFALAERAQVADQEEAVEAVVRDLATHALSWPRSGLPARVWVTGMAQRRFQLLQRAPLSDRASNSTKADRRAASFAAQSNPLEA
ncbi:hypothetical protein [Deinococcus sp. QL22]|uniref:hypothetical protein n=1 Tax=Deinococcus sp. QL22 TaxID=2939437 RepID=UPI002016D1E7|nr:hypothetical protein [Deinococcus sp. QL22]UQN08052.1 hypothetical protein M1R55_18340 [Deinococcus sp. QL22]